MKVLNVHERELPVPAERAGALLDALASPRDALWPRQCWPPMLLDRPLGVGAAGGHGPVRYFVEQYTPGQCVRFRFTGPKGYDGWHAFDVRPSGERGCILRHTIDMTAHGPAVLSWPLAVRWMHDACVEDAFALAQASLGLPPLVRKWPLRVRLLRWLASGGKSGPQVAPASVAR